MANAKVCVAVCTACVLQILAQLKLFKIITPFRKPWSASCGLPVQAVLVVLNGLLMSLPDLVVQESLLFHLVVPNSLLLRPT